MFSDITLNPHTWPGAIQWGGGGGGKTLYLEFILQVYLTS